MATEPKEYILLCDHCRVCIDLDMPTWQHIPLIGRFEKVSNQQKRYKEMHPSHLYSLYEIQEVY